MRCIIVGKNMYIAYVDESGDDGNPGSSESFVLTSVYMHYEAWRGNLDTITAFRLVSILSWAVQNARPGTVVRRAPTGLSPLMFTTLGLARL